MTFEEDIAKAVKTLKSGGIILYPTDTIWGIGCDATNDEAVKRLFDIKQRPAAKSMLMLIDDADRLYDYITDVPEMAITLCEVSEKPITIIYDNATGVSPLLIADDGSVGIRITSEHFSKELCRRLGRPLVSTSANLSGEPTSGIFAEIPDEIIDSVDYVAEYRRGENSAPAPSSIVKLHSDNTFKIIRK